MLQQQHTFLIVPCNKNLGPAIIEHHDYLKIAMQDHLNDTTTYKSLTSSETDHYASEIRKQILAWLKTYNKKLTKVEHAFIQEELNSNQSPYARFYLTLKAHKLKPGQAVDHLKPVQSFLALAACFMASVSGWIVSFKKSRKKQYPTSRTHWNSKNNYSIYTYPQTHVCSPLMPCPCTPTFQHTWH